MNWISVLQSLPTAGHMVLVLISCEGGSMQSIRSAQYTHETHYVQNKPTHWYNPNHKAAYTNVTHWMEFSHREELQ